MLVPSRSTLILAEETQASVDRLKEIPHAENELFDASSRSSQTR